MDSKTLTLGRRGAHTTTYSYKLDNKKFATLEKDYYFRQQP